MRMAGRRAGAAQESERTRAGGSRSQAREGAGKGLEGVDVESLLLPHVALLLRELPAVLPVHAPMLVVQVAVLAAEVGLLLLRRHRQHVL